MHIGGRGGGGPRFQQNFRHPGPQQQFGQGPQQQFGQGPPQRFQGQALQPWPEMGSFGLQGAGMNRPRLNSPPFPCQNNNNNNNHVQNIRPNMGPNLRQNFGPNAGQNQRQNMQGNYQNMRPDGNQMMRPGMRPSGPWNGPRFPPRGQPGNAGMPPHGQPGPPGFFNGPRHNHSQPRFQHNQQKQKKQKVDKRELPENNRYFCEVCDRGYKDEDKYQLHLNSHEKCPKEGCSYTAAGKLVQLHIRLQHNSGMAKKIWSLETEADIKKWREDRKQNFPTSENIAKKKALLAEKIARGEVIEEKYFGKMRGHNQRGRGRGRGRDRGNRGRGQHEAGGQHSDLKRKADDGDNTECSAAKKVNTEGGETEQTMKERMDSLGVFFNPADSDSSEDSSSDSDDDDKTTKPTEPGAIVPPSAALELTAAGALGSLMSMYADSDSEQGPEEILSKDVKPEEKKPNNTAKGDSTHNKSPHTDNKQRNKKRGRAGKGRQAYKPPIFDKTLLEKLLAKEIRQERNKIMQCVHYIVKNNFFDKTVTDDKTVTNDKTSMDAENNETVEN